MIIVIKGSHPVVFYLVKERCLSHIYGTTFTLRVKLGATAQIDDIS